MSNATVITFIDYKSIMTDYADAQDQLVGISTKYFDAAYTVLVTNVFDPEIDLLIAFHNAYIVSQGAYSSAPTSAVNAINALQGHVLNQSTSIGNGSITIGEKYDDINDYYEDYPGQWPTGGSAIIPQSFADISAQSGHTINSTFIAP